MDNVERGQRLIELREAAGLKQRQVGARFDIDGRAVSEWERGKSSPSRERLLTLDEMYQADGEVLRMFGVAPDMAADLRQLRTEFSGLRETVERLRLQVAGLSTDAADLGEQFEVRIAALERSLPGQREQDSL